MKRFALLVLFITATTITFPQTTTVPANTNPATTKPVTASKQLKQTPVLEKPKSNLAFLPKKEIEIRVTSMQMRLDAVPSQIVRYRTAYVTFEIVNHTTSDRDLTREPLYFFFREVPDTSFYPPSMSSVANQTTQTIIKSGETRTLTTRFDVTRALLADRKYMFYVELGYPRFLRKESTTGLFGSAEPVYVNRTAY